MPNIIRFVVAIAAIAVAAVPALSLAATFAYVNTQGEVRTVTADSASIALMTAPNIDSHSGVLLLDSADDNVILGK